MSRSERERDWAPRRELESWLGLRCEVEMLQVPPAFGRAHVTLTLSSGVMPQIATQVATLTRDTPVYHPHHGAGVVYWAAASKEVMRSGRHFVQVTVRCVSPLLRSRRPSSVASTCWGS